MSLKEVKQRIISVKNTQKITSAMKLISAAKLRRAQSVIDGVRPYQQKLDEILVTFLSGSQHITTPYTRSSETKRVAVIAISSNSSLCGSFNANIIRLAKEVINSYSSLENNDIEIYPIGKKIFDSLKKSGYSLNDSLMPQLTTPQYAEASKVAYKLMQQFANGELDRIELVYTHFYSPAKQIATRETFLPIDLSALNSKGENISHDFIVEPNREAIIEQLIPKVIAMRLYTALLDSITAEHAARMLAMQIATDNADDLITTLVREYNKSRQQTITNELLDIVAGSMN
ncbi:MAG: ATP synthase F1 subunit gamma [Bacteroidaceae bacterium]|nr:ATP synthase F1 subunit gamma [Bacteroidaceae bacterium]